MAQAKWSRCPNEALWFITAGSGSLWISTASFWRNRSIERWVAETKKPWAYWYRRGYRCRKAKLKFQIQ